MFDTSFFFHLFPIMFRYIGVTLGISLASLVLSLVIAIVIATAYYLNIPLLRGLCAVWVSVFRGTPLLAQLFWLCYGLPQLIVPLQRVSVMTLIVWGVAFNASSYMSETLRGGIQGVSQGQYDAARSIGMRYVPMMVHVILPQALMSVAPALVNEVITVLKSSSLVATIGLADMMRAAENVQALTYRAFEPFVAIAVVYYVIVMALVAVGRRLELRIRRMQTGERDA